MFHSMLQYYTSLRQEGYSAVENTPYRAAVATRTVTPQELEALCAVLKLTCHIAELVS